jgi:hypothetical protein
VGTIKSNWQIWHKTRFAIAVIAASFADSQQQQQHQLQHFKYLQFLQRFGNEMF